MIYARVYFPVQNHHLAAILATLEVCYPNAWSGVMPDHVVIADEPMGQDPCGVSQAVKQLLEPTQLRGNRWGEKPKGAKGA